MTLIIRANDALINPPSDAGILSAVNIDPLVYMDANFITGYANNHIVTTPFTVGGEGAEVIRTFDYPETPGTPSTCRYLANVDGMPALTFNENEALHQISGVSKLITTPIIVALVCKVTDWSKGNINSRLWGIGNTEEDRLAIYVNDGTLHICTTADPSSIENTGFTSSKFFSIVVKFDAENSKYIVDDGDLISAPQFLPIQNNDTSGIHLGVRYQSSGYLGKSIPYHLRHFSVYEGDATDDELIALNDEIRYQFNVV